MVEISARASSIGREKRKRNKKERDWKKKDRKKDKKKVRERFQRGCSQDCCPCCPGMDGL